MGGCRRSLACWTLTALLAGGCDSPPTREEFLEKGVAQALAPVSATPPLDEKVMRRAAQTEAQRDFVRRVHALESATGRPLVAGNQVTLLLDGPATHAAQLAAISRARHHVHLVAYIFCAEPRVPESARARRAAR